MWLLIFKYEYCVKSSQPSNFCLQVLIHIAFLRTKKFLSLRAFLQTLIPKVKNAFNTCVYESISHPSQGLSIRFL
jgi:hypothetical protein